MSFTVRALALVALTIPATTTPAPVAAVDRPNVVVIMVDDMPEHALWVLDDTLRLLGEQGTTYTNAVVEYALCCPSRVSFLTGQFSHNHGIVANKGGYAKFKKSPRFRSNLGTWMQDAGYQTALVGKFLNGYGGAIPTEVPPGWDEWCGMVGDTAYRYVGYKMNCNGTVTFSQQYQTDRIADIAVQQITELAAGGPFFQWITPLAPHTQSGKTYAIPSAEYAGTHSGEQWRPPNWSAAGALTRPPLQRNGALNASEIAQIDHAYPALLEALESVDDLVVRVVEALRPSGELDSTVIVFTSDHGYFLGEFGIHQGKIHPYEPALSVPLLVRGPGFAAGAVDDRLTVNADLTATILDIAEVQLSGASVAPSGEGPTSVAPLDGVPLGDLYPNRAVPLFGITGTKTYRGVRTDSEVWWTVAGVAERYDLAADPWQLHNLTTSAGGWKLDTQRQALVNQLGACDGVGCVVTWP